MSEANQMMIARLGGPSQKEFESLSAHLKRLTGIHLIYNHKNIALFTSRLHKLIIRHRVDSYRSLVNSLEQGDRELALAFISAMTTNTTHFFREKQHFTLLENILTEQLPIYRQKKIENPIRIWCAACSTGEEPYSLAMTISELQHKNPFNVKMLATDIDTRILDRAKDGIYTEQQVKDIPKILLERYFNKQVVNSQVCYRVKESLKSWINFGRFNLLYNYPFKSKFDVIFCRNVLIYFDRKDVSYVINQLVSVLDQDGYLFLGHSEAIAGMVKGLKRIGPAVYKKC